MCQVPSVAPLCQNKAPNTLKRGSLAWFFISLFSFFASIGTCQLYIIRAKIAFCSKEEIENEMNGKEKKTSIQPTNNCLWYYNTLELTIIIIIIILETLSVRQVQPATKRRVHYYCPLLIPHTSYHIPHAMDGPWTQRNTQCGIKWANILWIESKVIK